MSVLGNGSTAEETAGRARGRPAAVVEDLCVSYRTYGDAPKPSMTQMLARRRHGGRNTVVQAVRGVSLTLYEGETLGLIGANGSGKSTLMSAMTGLLPIDSGRLRVRSRPRLLGVNAALRPAVSGRRNIVIGALAQGFTLKEVQERIDDIIEFVDIGEAIDRPMRTYSSGMRGRLSFAIATLSPPEILLIDEALVMGDAAFMLRSQQMIDDIRQQAGAIVLVTHALHDIRTTADRVIWLDKGEIVAEGDPEAVVGQYEEAVQRAHETRGEDHQSNGT